MPRVSRPAFDPLPDPPGLDPVLLQDFQLLAGELLPPAEAALDQGAVDSATAAATLPVGELALEDLGRSLADGAVELAAMEAEAAPDTLDVELARAAEQDAALAQAGQGIEQSWPET